MRIALLSHAFVPHPGGVEIVVENLARELSSEHEVVVVSTGWERHRGVSREGSFEVHRLAALHFTERLGVPYPLPFGPGVRAAVRKLRNSDVLHAHGTLYPTSVAAAAIAARDGVPMILTEHVGFVEHRSRLLNAVQRLAWATVGDRVVRRAAAITTVGDRVTSWLRARYPGSQPKLVRNGVDSARFRRLTPEARTAARRRFRLPLDRPIGLFVGRHIGKKNLDAVLRIPRTEFHLALAGERSTLEGPELTDLGLLPHAEMPVLYGCADFLVHAGVGEGFPLVVQEALSCGLAVVLLWDAGYESIVDRDCVRACESLAEIAAAAVKLAADATALDELGRRGRAFAEARWSWSSTANAYLSLYREAARKFAA